MGRRKGVLARARERRKRDLRAAYDSMGDGINRSLEEAYVKAPSQDKEVAKTVPALADGEIIGTTVIYADGTFDIVVKKDISPQAKVHLEEFKLAMMAQYDFTPVTEEEADGSA